ncbi:MAG: PorV/PorQ family protein [Elusimicrobia bacterium]|nr:PorV/PorQ family protein [Elusimicrobiota bacterium]
MKLQNTLLIVCLGLQFQIGWASSGASFLNIGVGARALSLGSAYTAGAQDVTALYWNPAGLSRIETREFGAMHAEFFDDIRYDFAGYAQSTRLATFGVGVFHLGYGELEGRGENRRRTETFAASDQMVVLAISKNKLDLPWTPGERKLSLGVNMKLLRSVIQSYASEGFALDVGGMFLAERRSFLPSIGFVAQNLGPKMKFNEESFELPLTLGLGAEVSPVSRISILTDIKHSPYQRWTTWSAGVEITPFSHFSLRSGFSSILAGGSNDIHRISSSEILDIRGLGMGFGFQIKSVSLDYSLTPLGELGVSQRVFFSLRF